VFVAVAFAHVVLLYLLATYRRLPLVPAVDEPTTVSEPAMALLWLSPVNSTSASNPTSDNAVNARDRPSRRARASREPGVEQPARSDEPAQSVNVTGAATTDSPSAIDWYGEAPSAASRALSGEAERRRQAAAFAPPQPPPSLARPPPAGYRFGWSEVATQRFRVVNGVPLIRVNEHCTVAFFILATCTIGKINRRGDLFQHIHDPPPEGQANLP